MSDQGDDVYTFGTQTGVPMIEAAPKPVSPLEALKARLDARASSGAPVVTLPVPGLDGVQVRYRCQVSGAQRESWVRLASRKSQDNPKGQFRLHEFAWLVLAHCCEAILVGGEALIDDEHGVEATFASPIVRTMVGATKSSEAVAALYAADGACVATATDVMIAAGWAGIDGGDDEGPEDPT